MERTRIGSLFGVPGMYVSQPGDSLAAPTRALMFDSRYDGYQIYTQGRVRMEMIDHTNSDRTYNAEVYYPSLGYMPQIAWGAIPRGSNILHYNSTALETARGNFFYPIDAVLDVTPGRLIYRPKIYGGSEMALDFYYVIYRNPRVTTTYAPTGTERVFIGNDAGTFKMRVSKPGFHARFATLDQCLVHEASRPLIPALTGTVSIAGRPNQFDPAPSAGVYLGRSFTFPPKIVVNAGSSTNIGVSLGMSDGLMTLYNSSTSAVTARYVIYLHE